MVILAVILPGNRVMPLGDLSQFVFFIACMVPVFKEILFVLGYHQLSCLVVDYTLLHG